MGPGRLAASRWTRARLYIESGKQEGARLVAGGGRASVGGGKGYFIEPTVFDGVTNRM